jgi:hypothetical protein
LLGNNFFKRRIKKIYKSNDFFSHRR